VLVLQKHSRGTLHDQSENRTKDIRRYKKRTILQHASIAKKTAGTLYTI